MGLTDGVKQWLFSKALAKAVKFIVTAVVSYLTSAKIAAILAAMSCGARMVTRLSALPTRCSPVQELMITCSGWRTLIYLISP